MMYCLARTLTINILDFVSTYSSTIAFCLQSVLDKKEIICTDTLLPIVLHVYTLHFHYYESFIQVCHVNEPH